MNKPKVKSFVLFLLPFAILLSGCRQDMHDNPRLEAYEEGANRQLPEGTVARGSLATNPSAPKITAGAPAAPTPAQSTGTAPAAGAAAASAVPVGEDGFPFPITKEILDRGQNRYEISCLPCHGKLGTGDGMIVRRGFRRAGNFQEDRLRKAPASYFYDVMTNGFGAMASYSDQLTPEDRWKVAAYIRVLQLSQNMPYNDLKDEDRKKLEEAEKAGTSSGGQHK
ncbi:MAG: cytochrome c [Acidobacteria bacterium]|nr:cytochrome c [Acidobacteriota bacterium]